MKTVQVEPLTLEAFTPFGSYSSLTEPNGPMIGAAPIEFYRDAAQLELLGRNPSFSSCRVQQRDFVIDVLEYHSQTGEGILPLDADVLLHLAPASVGDQPDLNALKVFRVPHGTFIALRPGVWHHGPFALSGVAHVLIVLPERTYKNDCVVVPLGPDQQLEIEV